MSVVATWIGCAVMALLGWALFECAWWLLVCAVAARQAFGRWRLRDAWLFWHDYIPDEIEWPGPPRRIWNGERWKRAARRCWWHPYRWRRLRMAIFAAARRALQGERS